MFEVLSSWFMVLEALGVFKAWRLKRLVFEVHYGLEQAKIQTAVLGHLLVRSLVRSHRSLIRLLRPACFTHALCCAHSFVSTAHTLTPELVGK